MAFTPATFSLVFAATSQVWFYKSADLRSVIAEPDYFAPVYNQLKEHDAIVIVSDTGGSPTPDLTAIYGTPGATEILMRWQAGDGGFPEEQISPTLSEPDIILSNGAKKGKRKGKVADSGYKNALSALKRTTGKRYFEVLVAGLPGDALIGAGIHMDGLSNSQKMGVNAESFAYHSDGNTTNNNIDTDTTEPYVEGDRLGVAVDLTAGKIWFCNEDGYIGAGDPSAGTGENYAFTPNGAGYRAGISFFFDSELGDVEAWLYLDEADMEYTIPTDFLAWNA